VIELKIKPLSVNAAYSAVKIGKRASLAKSKEYKAYTKQLPLLLPSELQLPPGKLVLIIKFYFATAASDVDNPIKPMQDLICDYYGVNDNQIYLLLVEKNTGNKGKERIEFEFLAYDESQFNKCRNVIINTD
jgi:Holliday junction resolvase RusA-like endonuclease